jgi:hypothetical protein
MIPIAILMSVLAIGFIGLRRTLLVVRERKAYLHEFSRLFGEYVKSGAQDERIYVELTQRVMRMQGEMGALGMMSMFRPAFANFAYRNYAILPNMLPDYRQYANDWALRSQAVQYASTIRDALVRYSGTLDEVEADVLKELKNPLTWFSEGTRALVATPFKVLRSVGVLSEAQEAGISGSALLRIGSGILALVGLAAGLVQIITGWDAMLKFIRDLLK